MVCSGNLMGSSRKYLPDANAAACIWKKRNDFIFNHKVPLLENWKQLFKNEVKLHLFRLPADKRVLVMSWVNML
jgi:hypothetical protein